MGEHRLAYRETGGRLEVEQARQYASVTAGVEDKVGLDLITAGVFAYNLQQRFAALDIDCGHGFAIADFDALQCGLVGQQLVEIGALDLERGRLAIAEGVTKIEGAVLLAPGKGSAVLELKTGGLHRLEHAGFFDEIQAVRQQAFADGEAREVLALDDQYIMAFAFEQGSRDCTGGPGTNHHHLTTFHIYY